MRATLQTSRREDEIVGQNNRQELVCDCVKTRADMSAAIDKVARTMALSGFPRCDIVGVRVAVEEAVLNAFKHAYRDAPGNPVFIRHAINRDQVVLEIEDQGTGFNLASIPDPTQPENWERDSGRGIFLMRTYMTFVGYNDRGNCVTLCKQASIPLGGD